MSAQPPVSPQPQVRLIAAAPQARTAQPAATSQPRIMSLDEARSLRRQSRQGESPTTQTREFVTRIQVPVLGQRAEAGPSAEALAAEERAERQWAGRCESLAHELENAQTKLAEQ